jgi:hypothetical protein
MTMDPKDRKSEQEQEQEPEGNWEQDLDHIQSAYSALETSEPPGLLDQAILNTARRELAARRKKPMRWIGAFATASVFVLALTIVIQQNREAPLTGRSNDIKLDAVTQPRAKEESPATEIDSERSLRTKQSAAFKREKKPAPVPLNEPASVLVEPAFEAAPVAAGDELPADTDLRLDAKPAKSESKEQLKEGALELKDAARQSIPIAAEKAAREQLVEEAVIGSGTAASPMAEQEVSAEDLPDPDEWIRHMLLLRQSQLYEKLEAELAAFKKAYPDYPLPRELED